MALAIAFFLAKHGLQQTRAEKTVTLMVVGNLCMTKWVISNTESHYGYRPF